ncbi:MSC_0621 family F1-like ATPase epsilon subunit [Metamycoplasma equirhinis]|uniref:MSC_0621 family F1-like ATPase epsilon subunit n=1 Tax=Metamycoplasma equirhinis TaxID=92402 RepID=UPI0035934408
MNFNKRANENSFDIVINFVSKKPYILKNGLIYLNVGNENKWELIQNRSIASYPNTIIKIVDPKENREWFMFLSDVSVFANENKIQINTFSNYNKYLKVEEDVDLNDTLKDVTKEIDYFNARQNFGLNINQFILLTKLKREQYISKMSQILNLRKAEKYE